MPGTLSERAHAAVEHVQDDPVRFADRVFFSLGTLAAGWLAFLLIYQTSLSGFRQIWWTLVPFWIVVTYLLLPRVHSVLSRIYLPDYFIGRTRTREGVLGDPVNLGLRGTEDQVHAAMIRAGWHRADELTLWSGWGIVRSTLGRRTYPNAPVSSLYLFGRRQAFTYQQEVEGNPAKRHHVRFWPAPTGWRLPGGSRVDWLAAGTYDRAVGLNLFTLQFTHRIAADVDTERDHIVATLTDPGAGNGEVRTRVLRHFATGYHHRNGGGDRIETDGDLPVLDLRHTAPAPPEVRERILRDRAAIREHLPVPITVAFGVAVMLSRVVLGIVELVRSAAVNPALVDDLSDAGLDPALVVGVSQAVLGVYLAAYAVLAVFVYRGHGWARTAALVLSSVSVLLYVALWFTAPSERALALTLLGTAVEILVLLALSGDTARRYTSRRRAQPSPS